MKKTQIIISLSIIFLLAVILRVVGITQQGFFFPDEAGQFARAFHLSQWISSGDLARVVAPRITDTKILWVILVGLAQYVFRNAYYSAHLTSFFFGLLTIGLTYKFAHFFYQSKKIALYSALILSISSYHVFYSRLAMPEAAGGFMAVLMVYVYLKGLIQKRHFIILAGIICGLSFLLNRFRCAMFPFMILSVELLYPKKTKGGIKRYLAFILSMTGVYVAYELFLKSLRLFDIYIQPYWQTLQMSLSGHHYEADWFTMLTYPYYLYLYEGIVVCFLLVTAFFFLRKKPSPLIPLIFILMQIVASSLVDEECARSISVVLPFISVVSAVSLWHIFEKINQFKYAKILKGTIVLLMVFMGIRLSMEMWGYRSHMKEAIEFIDKTYGRTKILSSRRALTTLYTRNNTILK